MKRIHIEDVVAFFEDFRVERPTQWTPNEDHEHERYMSYPAAPFSAYEVEETRKNPIPYKALFLFLACWWRTRNTQNAARKLSHADRVACSCHYILNEAGVKRTQGMILGGHRFSPTAQTVRKFPLKKHITINRVQKVRVCEGIPLKICTWMR